MLSQTYRRRNPLPHNTCSGRGWGASGAPYSRVKTFLFKNQPKKLQKVFKKLAAAFFLPGAGDVTELASYATGQTLQFAKCFSQRKRKKEKREANSEHISYITVHHPPSSISLTFFK